MFVLVFRFFRLIRYRGGKESEAEWQYSDEEMERERERDMYYARCDKTFLSRISLTNRIMLNHGLLEPDVSYAK